MSSVGLRALNDVQHTLAVRGRDPKTQIRRPFFFFFKEILHSRALHVFYISVELPVWSNLFGAGCRFIGPIQELFYLHTDELRRIHLHNYIKAPRGLHSPAAVSVAMRAKTCLSAASFDAAYYANFLIHLPLGSEKTHTHSSVGKDSRSKVRSIRSQSCAVCND